MSSTILHFVDLIELLHTVDYNNDGDYMINSVLSELRAKKNMTQKQIAKELGLTYQRYNHYETGKRQPDNETLKLLASYFGVSTDYLLGHTEDPSPSPIPPYKSPDANYYCSHELWMYLNLCAQSNHKSFDRALERLGLDRFLTEDSDLGKPTEDLAIFIDELQKLADYFSEPLDSLLIRAWDRKSGLEYDPYAKLPRKYRKMIETYNQLSESDDEIAKRMKDTIDQLLGLNESEVDE